MLTAVRTIKSHLLYSFGRSEVSTFNQWHGGTDSKQRSGNASSVTAWPQTPLECRKEVSDTMRYDNCVRNLVLCSLPASYRAEGFSRANVR